MATSSQKKSHQQSPKSYTGLKITGIFAVVAGIASVPIGLWNESSEHYYRELIQNATFSLAENFQDHPELHPTISRYTKWALQFDQKGITLDKIQRFAYIFSKIGEKDNAALLALGLAKAYHELNLPEKAKEAANFSFGLNQSEQALLTLIILSNPKTTLEDGTWISTFPQQPFQGQLPINQTFWYQKLVQQFPQSPLISVKECVDGVNNFENALPSSCAKLDWLSTAATTGHERHQELSRQITILPAVAADTIKDETKAIENETRTADQLLTYRTEIVRKKGEVVSNNLIDFAKGLFFIPKQNDTVETYAAREGVCLALPKGLCTIVDGVMTLSNISKEKDKYTAIIGEIDTARTNCYVKINQSKSTIAWWESSGPKDSLEKEQNNLIPAFRKTVYQNVRMTFSSPGIELKPALDSIINSPN